MPTQGLCAFSGHEPWSVLEARLCWGTTRTSLRKTSSTNFVEQYIDAEENMPRKKAAASAVAGMPVTPSMLQEAASAMQTTSNAPVRKRPAAILKKPAAAGTATTIPSSVPNSTQLVVQANQAAVVPTTPSQLVRLGATSSHPVSSLANTPEKKLKPSNGVSNDITPEKAPASRLRGVTISSKGWVKSPKASSDRVLTTGKSLPLGMQLRVKKVSQVTLNLYDKAIHGFEQWCREKNITSYDHARLDRNVCRYLDILAMKKRSTTDGAYLIYGLQLLRCTMPKQEYLPNAKEQLAGWKHDCPGNMRLGVAEELVDAACGEAISSGKLHDLEAVLASQIAMDTYFRPTETVTLTMANVVPPAGGRYEKYGLLLAPSDAGDGHRTKNGEVDAGVLLADKSRKWLPGAMKMWTRDLGPADALFPSLTLSSYEKFWDQSCANMGYPSKMITPHILRHSAASNDLCHNRRSLEEAQKRGQWRSRKSLTRYGKEALMLKSWTKIGCRKQADVKRQARGMPAKLLSAISKFKTG